MAQAIAPDFEAALADLQANLPQWWATRDEGSTLYEVLAAIGESLDALAWAFEQPYLDQSITTASEEGLLRNFALAWGVENERLPPTAEQLRAYIQARAAEDGSLESLLKTLMSLLETPQNTTGGPVVKFPTPTVKNPVLNPSFEYDAVGAEPADWIFAAASEVTKELFAVSETWAASGTKSIHLKAKHPANTVNKNADVLLAQSARIPVTPGQIWTFQAALNIIAAVNTNFHFQFAWYKSDNTTLLSENGTTGQFTGQTGVHTLVGTTTAAPAEAAYLGFSIRAASSESNATYEYYVDEIIAAEGAHASLTYFDGDTPGYIWAGTPGNSATEGPVLYFPTSGAGITLYEFEPGHGPKGGLIFPANGEGLRFPAAPESLLSEDGRLTGATGETPPGPPGVGLTFSQNGYVSILQNTPGPYELEVETLNWLDFDRKAFQRAVERFQPAHCLPARIREVAQVEL